MQVVVGSDRTDLIELLAVLLESEGFSVSVQASGGGTSLLLAPEHSVDDIRVLISKWHGHDKPDVLG